MSFIFTYPNFRLLDQLDIDFQHYSDEKHEIQLMLLLDDLDFNQIEFLKRRLSYVESKLEYLGSRIKYTKD